MPEDGASVDPATAGDDAVRAHDAWIAVLDELERGLAAAADSGAAAAPGADIKPSGSWTPPPGIGPLPSVLADRAARLLHAQLDVESLLKNEHARVARHLVAVRAIDPARPARESVYLDVLS
jgi:hypothetical protein